MFTKLNNRRPCKKLEFLSKQEHFMNYISAPNKRNPDNKNYVLASITLLEYKSLNYNYSIPIKYDGESTMSSCNDFVDNDEACDERDKQ